MSFVRFRFRWMVPLILASVVCAQEVPQADISVAQKIACDIGSSWEDTWNP